MSKRIVIVLAAATALSLPAQERPAQFESVTKMPGWAPLKWDPAVEQRAQRLTLGRSDISVSGPLVDTFRMPSKAGKEQSLGRRILSLPIINMFVPEPLPKPTRQGTYFAWGEREAPWGNVSERPRTGPQGVLVNVTR